MTVNKSGVALLFAAMGAAFAIAVAPVAFAGECDPAVVVCDTPGNVDSPGNVQINDSPPPVSSDDQYPYDGDWYFDPAGGGTVLQPSGPHGGGSGGGGGGGHR